jgi:nicotinamidase-related amidase
VEGLLRLTELVRERKPALVVIDPLFRFTRLKDEKAYAEIYNALGPLIDLARETGTHVMLTHHSGKLPKTDPIDSPLGSTALASVVATLISLNRSGKYRTICTVQRIGDDMPETVLLFDKATRSLTLGGTKESCEQHDAEQRILEFLEEKEPQKQADIREGVEGTTKAIRAALTALVKNQRVSRTGEGLKGKPFLYSLWFSGFSGSTTDETGQTLVWRTRNQNLIRRWK